MSIHVMSWVLRRSEARLGARLVLLVLADHANADGTESFPKVETIAFEARLSKREVQYALKKLAEDGWIVETGRTRAGTRKWRIVMGVQTLRPGGADFAPEPSLTVQPRAPVSKETSARGGSRKRDLHWEALARAMGREPMSRSERGAWNAALKELKDAGVSPEEIEAAAERYEREWPEAELTPTALARHASRFLTERTEDLGDGWVRVGGQLRRKDS